MNRGVLPKTRVRGLSMGYLWLLPIRDRTSAAINMPTIEGIASKPGTPAALADTLGVTAVALVVRVGVVRGLPVAEEDDGGA